VICGLFKHDDAMSDAREGDGSAEPNNACPNDHTMQRERSLEV
jgi:hypothetical protein